jgi:hypothetical protein
MEASERGLRCVELGASQPTGVCGGAVGDGSCLAAIGGRRPSRTEYNTRTVIGIPLAGPPVIWCELQSFAGCKLTEVGVGVDVDGPCGGRLFCFVKKKIKQG